MLLTTIRPAYNL